MCVQGSPKPLGRAFAEPEIKIVEQYYQKPRLRFYDISLGRAAAGEVLAAFELIELDYSGFGEVISVTQSINQCIYGSLALVLFVCPSFLSLITTFFEAEIWEYCDITNRKFERSCLKGCSYQVTWTGYSLVAVQSWVPSSSPFTRGLLVLSFTSMLRTQLVFTFSHS